MTASGECPGYTDAVVWHEDVKGIFVEEHLEELAMSSMKSTERGYVNAVPDWVGYHSLCQS